MTLETCVRSWEVAPELAQARDIVCSILTSRKQYSGSIRGGRCVFVEAMASVSGAAVKAPPPAGTPMVTAFIPTVISLQGS
jgi:hypothetical protein